MTIEADFMALLSGYAPLTALVDDRIAQDAVPSESTYPLVVFAATHDRTIGLDRTLLTDQCSLQIQCWGNTGVEASAVADAVTAAIATAPPAVGALVLERATTHDPEMGLDGVGMTAVWWFLA